MQGECFKFLNFRWNFRPQKGFGGSKSRVWEKIDKFPADSGDGGTYYVRTAVRRRLCEREKEEMK